MFAEIVFAVAMSHAKNPEIPTYVPPSGQASYAACVAIRESQGNPRAVNPTGKYRGRYQFSEELKDGATWMMLDWLKTWHPHPRIFAMQLRELPMNKWPAKLQDAAFYETLNNDGLWSGKRHWANGRYAC